MEIFYQLRNFGLGKKSIDKLITTVISQTQLLDLPPILRLYSPLLPPSPIPSRLLRPFMGLQLLNHPSMGHRLAQLVILYNKLKVNGESDVARGLSRARSFFFIF